MPSASKRTARPSFYEVVFQGSPKVVRGFLAGLQIGCGEQATVLYHFDAGIFDESQAGRLAERIGFKRADCHVVVDRSLCDRLRKLADEIAEETGLVIESCRNVRSAEMSFKFTVYARRYQQEIMKLIKELPAGLRVADFQYHEDIDPRAEGIEAYAPAHDYAAHGEGKIIGRVDLLVEHRRKLARQPLIEEGEIHLKLA
jgi:hypothetical protein